MPNNTNTQPMDKPMQHLIVTAKKRPNEPKNDPKQTRHVRLMVALLSLANVLCPITSTWAQPSPNVSPFANGLKYPRGLKFGPDGNLYVAEAGAGGPVSTEGTCDQVQFPLGPYHGGFSARISKVSPDGQTVSTVADNLPSAVEALGDVIGVADVAFVGNTLYALEAAGGCSHGLAGTSAEILRVDADGKTTPVANLSHFQQTHPTASPHTGPGYEPDGSWYSMISVRGALYAVEPNHDELDRITVDGHIQRVADISATEGHIISTACVYDGNFYIGNLGVFPIVGGSSKVLKITPSGQIKTVATGFTTTLGLAFDAQHRLYVLENTTGNNLFPTPGTGKITRIDHSGQLELVAWGLSLPTAMTFGPDGKLYVSNWGFGPPGLGEIVRVTVPE
jgi:glucose/arabinose dehydrogenase